mmetsp:Transcript_88057/g.233790  ORF Transcript_88057/g.233790 Transcript_88057/m.233790 type:complete len:247 (+) Transcript_88057:755-1495(+)
MRQPYRWRATSAARPAHSRAMNASCSVSTASTTLWITKLACRDCTASMTCPWSSETRLARSPGLALVMASCTTQHPAGSQEACHTDPWRRAIALAHCSPPSLSHRRSSSHRSASRAAALPSQTPATSGAPSTGCGGGGVGTCTGPRCASPRGTAAALGRHFGRCHSSPEPTPAQGQGRAQGERGDSAANEGSSSGLPSEPRRYGCQGLQCWCRRGASLPPSKPSKPPSPCQSVVPPDAYRASDASD